MNHELIMLREVKRMHKLTQSLTKEAKYKAVKSHLSYNVKNGTMGQIAEICQTIQLRDECLLFCLAVANALKTIDKDKSTLLKDYYINQLDILTLSTRLKVSKSSVYNRLHIARMQFTDALIKLGCDEQWLTANFSHIDFIKARLEGNG